MKTTFHAITFITILLLISGCGGGHEENHDESTHEHATGDHELVLDDGKLWKANSETTEFIGKMKELVEETSGSQHLLDYEILNEKLSILFGNIFEYCTMEGEAHEQLHNFMLPMKTYIKGIASDDLVTCQENLNALEKHLSTYEYFFE